MSVKNPGVDHGYLETALPSVNCLYKTSKNNHVATTDTIDPILLIKFHPAKASG